MRFVIVLLFILALVVYAATIGHTFVYGQVIPVMLAKFKVKPCGVRDTVT